MERTLSSKVIEDISVVEIGVTILTETNALGFAQCFRCAIDAIALEIAISRLTRA